MRAEPVAGVPRFREPTEQLVVARAPHLSRRRDAQPAARDRAHPRVEGSALRVGPGSILGARSAQPARALGREHPHRVELAPAGGRARTLADDGPVRSGVPTRHRGTRRDHGGARRRGDCCGGGDGRDRGRLSRGRAGGGRLGLLRLRQPGALWATGKLRVEPPLIDELSRVSPARAGAPRLHPLGRWSDPRAHLPSRPR